LIYLGASILIIVLGYVIGRLSKFLINIFLSRIGFNDWVRRISIGKAIIRAGFTPSEFFSSLIAWIIYVSSIFTAINFGSREISVVLGGVSYLNDLADISYSIVTIYLGGFIKSFLVIIVGFILVDGFIGYIYKVSEPRTEQPLLAPVAEYLRILLYIGVIIFALSVGGIGVGELIQILQPVVWGITAIMIVVVIEQVILRVYKK